MIWWRGRGLWILFLACIPAVAMQKAGATQTAIAYAASAALIYFMRDWLGDTSAVFSIPTRFWPPLLLVVALLVQFMPAKEKEPVLNDLQKIVAEIQASMPRNLNEQIRMDRVELNNGVLHYAATSLVPFDATGSQKIAFEQQVRQHYCQNSKALWQSNVGVAFTFKVPPRTLNDKVERYSVTLQPSECKAASQ